MRLRRRQGGRVVRMKMGASASLLESVFKVTLNRRRVSLSLTVVPFCPCPTSLTTVPPYVGVDVDFVMERSRWGFTLAKKAVNVQGGVCKRVAVFKEALGMKDATVGVKMCMDHNASISTCMMDLGIMEVRQRKKEPCAYLCRLL